MRRPEIDYILTTMLDSSDLVSDVNISVDRPLQVEVSGFLKKVAITPDIDNLTPFQTEIFALNLINSDRRLSQMLLQQGSCDSSYFLIGRARFRINIFSRLGNYSIAMRKLQAVVPSIDDLKLPEAFRKMTKEKNGLILVTGATGVGKTTSLAAVLRELNETKPIHVITLEDPVEFMHPNIKATFNQRELGMDFDTFANGLRAALREAPKVILVGEMRDRETAELALTASETGHLVLSSVHTIDAGQAISRIVGMFDQEEERQIRQRLADSVRWIIAQRLLPKVGGDRVAIHDILGNNIRTKEVILLGEQEGKTFYEIQEASEPFGMQTFDQAIIRTYEAGLIMAETAELYATRKPVVQRGIDKLKQARGEKTTDIEGLTIDSGYAKTVKKR
jgi:twitching motility protein PilT